MNQNNINKLKELQIKFLTEFIKVCDKYSLRYCLAYGTLLGAVREGGLIPWDHDVDVFMPFEDYRKLYQLNNSMHLFKDNLSLVVYDQMNTKMRNFKIVAKNTTLATKQHVIGHLFMDIYPIFNVNDKKCEDLSTLCTEFKKLWYDAHTRTADKNADIGKYIIDFENKISSLSNSKQNNRCIDLQNCIGYSYKNKVVNKERVDKYLIEDINFDDLYRTSFTGMKTQVDIPKNYDYLLRKWYGKYEIPKTEDIDFLFDTEIDCSYYVKTNTLPQ